MIPVVKLFRQKKGRSNYSPIFFTNTKILIAKVLHLLDDLLSNQKLYLRKKYKCCTSFFF